LLPPSVSSVRRVTGCDVAPPSLSSPGKSSIVERRPGPP
jgi:hypothetical protein